MCVTVTTLSEVYAETEAVLYTDDCVELYLMLCSDLTCGAVCVYPNQVSDSIASLKAAGASHIPVASGTVIFL